jgi:hypothetical protein
MLNKTEQAPVFTRRRNVIAASLCRGVGAVAAATWFRRLAETNLNPGWFAKHGSETAVIFQFFGIGE